jgi:hypothetical protein
MLEPVGQLIYNCPRVRTIATCPGSSPASHLEVASTIFVAGVSFRSGVPPTYDPVVVVYEVNADRSSEQKLFTTHFRQNTV